MLNFEMTYPTTTAMAENGNIMQLKKINQSCCSINFPSQSKYQKCFLFLTIKTLNINIIVNYLANGQLDYNEFEKLFVQVTTPPDHDTLVEAFTKYDKDDDKKLSRDEIKEVLLDMSQLMSDAGLDYLIEALDKDKDGKVNFLGMYLEIIHLSLLRYLNLTLLKFMTTLLIY